jgi:hypothetical protein
MALLRRQLTKHVRWDLHIDFPHEISVCKWTNHITKSSESILAKTLQFAKIKKKRKEKITSPCRVQLAHCQ